MSMLGAPGDASKNRTERVFCWIWRINGLMFFVFGLLIVISYLTDWQRQWKSRLSSPQGASSQASAPAEPAKLPALGLGSFEPVAGTRVYTAQLSENYYGNSPEYVLDAAQRVNHNTLFYDAATGANHWLFADHAEVICKLDALSANDPTDTAPSAWAWSKTEAGGSYRIGLADIDGNHAEALIEADACLEKSFLQADGTALLFYTHDGKPQASLIDVAHRRILRTDTLLAP
ncbi:hypothetical protein [Dyella silvatica]|uniref:hypothetical protein n=1 Tax=Dyella silvatica TaxID=2992128 RepID=UPI00224E4842|nr:hypothetical protein [Dyella silvatica]